MSDLSHPEWVELLLRAHLEKARDEFLNAAPDSLPAASARFRQALDTFTAFILRSEEHKPIEPARSSGGARGTRKTAA